MMKARKFNFKKKSLRFGMIILIWFLSSCDQTTQKGTNTEINSKMEKAIELQTGKLQINYTENSINFLKQKIAMTRYPDEITGVAGKYGYAKSSLKELLNYWKEEFDFTKHLERLNQWNNQIVEIDGYKLHYILEKSNQPDAIPIVFLHGWPSTFMQMSKLIPLLNANTNGPAYDVIIISLPGYGFSEITNQEGMAVHKMAELMQKLMVKHLGYEQFILRASDIGAGVAKEWALAYPDQVMGLHLSGSSPYIFYIPNDISEKEKEFVKEAQLFMQMNGAYASLHSTEPQTLAYALNDSPAGLASWILKRYQTWTDHGRGFVSSIFQRRLTGYIDNILDDRDHQFIYAIIF